MLRVAVKVLLEPLGIAPKLRLAGCSTSEPGLTAAPLSEKVKGEFGAVEATVTVPLALPADCGAKVTSSVALCPAARFSGVEIPLTVNPPEADT